MERVKEISIFRKAVKVSKSNWITTYEDLLDLKLAAAKLAGYKNLGFLYKYQKGDALMSVRNAILDY